MCLACSVFELEDDNIGQGLLKKMDFKMAGVPHYKKLNMSPMEVLNAILNNWFEAPMLMKCFLVQVLLPKHKHFQTETLMTTLKENSKWISQIKNFLQRNQFQKGYQRNLEPLWNSPHLLKDTSSGKHLRQNLSIRLTVIKISLIRTARKGGGKKWVQYPKMLSSKEYTNYIKDQFKRDTTITYMKETLLHSKVVGAKGIPVNPPYSISYDSLTYDIGLIEKQVHFIKARHYNAYLLVPRLVYHFSIKLKNDVIHNCLGQDDEVKVIHFLTRYGYATRANPYCTIHGAYEKYTNMHNVTYINNCDDWNRIIPVTMFLVLMLFNACFMYQPRTDTNLLITALNRFDYKMSLTDDTIMNSLGKFFSRIK